MTIARPESGFVEPVGAFRGIRSRVATWIALLFHRGNIDVTTEKPLSIVRL